MHGCMAGCCWIGSRGCGRPPPRPPAARARPGYTLLRLVLACAATLFWPIAAMAEETPAFGNYTKKSFGRSQLLVRHVRCLQTLLG
jgi:hypothetical protein